MTCVMSPMMGRQCQIDTEAPLNGFYGKTLLFQVWPEDGAVSPEDCQYSRMLMLIHARLVCEEVLHSEVYCTNEYASCVT